MGYPTQQQKVDYLFKKIGFTKTKTGVAEDQTSGFSGDTKKAPPNEAIASPLVVPSASLWSDSSLIPASPPGSDSAYVEGYRTSNAFRMTVDSTVANERTFIARQTFGDSSSAIKGDWIDTQFGADYLVKVYMGNPSGISTNLSAAGTSGKDDVWFFDYSSGVLNFNGADLDGQLAGISTDNVYLVGYRYTGAKGANAPAGIGTFHDLIVHNNFSVGGISTFSGLVDVNAELNTTGGRIVGAATSNVIPFLYSQFTDLPSASTYHGAFAHVHQYGKGYFAHANNWFEIVSKEIDGTIGLGTEKYNVGPIDATSLKVTGITTLGSIGISTGLISGPAITYIDPAAVGDNTGLLVVKGNLQVEGTQTTVNSSTMTVTDKNIELAKGAANDAAADTGGITVDSGDGDKTWQWLDATDSWTSSEHIRIPDDKEFGFASDTDTFISRPAANHLRFTTSNSQRLRIYGAGQIFIGDSSDSPIGGGILNIVQSSTTEFSDSNNLIGQANPAIIHVKNKNDTGTEAGLLLHSANAAAGGVAIYGKKTTDYNNDLIFRFRTGASTNAERVRIKSTGQVAIGTTVEGQVSADELTLSGSGSVGMTIRSTNSTESNIFMSDATTGNGEYAGWIKFKHNTTPNRWEFGAVNSQIFNILADGKVGINSDAPKATLDVNGGGNIQGDLNVTGITTALGFKTIGISTDGGVTNSFVAGRINIYDNNSHNIFRIGSHPSYAPTVWQTSAITFSTSSFNVSNVQSTRTYINIANSTGILKLGYGGASNHGFKLATSGIGVTVYGQVDTTTLNVTGISTLSGDAKLGANLNVVGVSTFNDDVRLIDHKSLYLGTSSKSWIRYNNILNVSQWYNITNPIEIGYRPAHLMWLNNRVLSTKLGGVNITGDTETDTLNVSGISTFGGAISVGSTTGTDGYYLKTTGIGVTWAPFPSSRTGLTTSATAGQTTFNFSYNIGFVDVFLNGVKLPSSEFTASNGSTIVLDAAAFANDTLEFISLNTLPVTSSGGAQNLTGLADVVISGTPVIGETLQHNGSEFVNDYTVSTTTTSTSQTAISSLPIANYRSVEYTIQATEGTKYHVTKVLAIHDGTNVTFNEFGTLTTSTSLSTFTLDINSGNMRLLATPASTNSTVFKVKFTGIKV